MTRNHPQPFHPPAHYQNMHTFPPDIAAAARSAHAPVITREKREERKAETRTASRFLPILFVVTATLFATVAPRAQRSQETGVNLTGVSARKTSDGKTIYTVAADGALNRAQTWHDANGQHVVLYKGGATLNRKSLPPGVRVGRVSDSLEIVLPTNAGQRVTVQQRGAEIDFIVSGESVQNEQNAANASAARDANREANAARTTRMTTRATRDEVARNDVTREAARRKNENVADSPSLRKSSAASIPNPPSAVAPLASPLVSTNNFESPQSSSSTPPSTIETPALTTETPVVPDAGTIAFLPATDTSDAAGDSSLYRYGLIFGAMMCGVLVLLFVRRRRRADELKGVEEFFIQGETTDVQPVIKTLNSLAGKKSRKGKNSKESKGSGAEVIKHDAHTQTSQALTTKLAAPAAHAPAAVFGAYQVDQAVSKLVAGEAHRLDVLCSRAIDDRRAIEASLMKALQHPEASDAARRKARQALEEYGFVARSCAALLLAPAAVDRLAAARTLGAVKSPTSLQFLVEALYDCAATIRVEAVTGLGALGSPAAIGALLDVARRHADIPPALLTNALTACSVESLNFGRSGFAFNRGELEACAADPAWTGEIMKLELVETVVALPEWLDDENLTDAFEGVGSSDAEARLAAVRRLAMFPARRAVESLAQIAEHDAEPNVRAAAVTSLGALDHETVFAPIVMRLIDDAREVRASAARALSRLSFDRADAYVRVVETDDADTIGRVAAALAGAGMVSQAIDRLISEDRRQAYEAFSLLSLLVKADRAELLLEAVATHRDTGTRLALVRFLGLANGARYIDSLREIAARPDAPPDVRTAIEAAAEKLTQVESGMWKGESYERAFGVN